MSSPDECDNDFWFTMDSPPAGSMGVTGDTFKNFLEKPHENLSLSSSSSENNAMGFDDFMEALDQPLVLNTLNENKISTPETQDQVMTIQKLVAEMTVDEQDKEETLLKIAMPRLPKGMLLQEYPFVLKLYLAASSDAIPMINWSPNGLQLVVEYQSLQDHLTGGSQIFRSRSVRQFTEKLIAEGFVRIHREEMYTSRTETATLKPVLLYYQQREFVRGDLGSLHNLIKASLLLQKHYPMALQYGNSDEEAEDEEPKFPVPLHVPSKSHLDRMQQRGDKCCSTVSVRSSIQEARCRFRTLLDHLATTKAVQASAKVWETNTMKKGRPWDFPTFTSSSVKFVRPHDSVITLEANKPLPEYAGYYGRVSPTKVTKFFSEYLPRYGNKTTGYKDIVLETTTKPSNFQQNLPIGLDYSDSDDNEPDVPPPVPPRSLDFDMDCMPSTSAAAAMKSSGQKRSVESVDDQELEEAMQELCGGSTALKENASSGSRGKAKAQPQPKSPKALSRKRRSKSYESTSSEDETVSQSVSRKVKRAKKETVKDLRKRLENNQEEAIEDDQGVLPKRRGSKAKTTTPKAGSRKRLTNPNKDEPSPSRKKAKKGLQDNRKANNKQLEELEMEEFLVKKKGGPVKTRLREADQENEDDDAEDNEHEYDEENEDEYDENEEENAEENQNEYNEEGEGVLQDDVENAEEDEYLEEEFVDEGEYIEEEIVNEGEYLDDNIAEEDEQPEEDQIVNEYEQAQEELSEDDYPEEQHLNGEEQPEEKEHPEEDEYSEEDEQPEENMNADETQDAEEDEDIDEDLNAEDGEGTEEEEDGEENDEPEGHSNAEEEEGNEEDSQSEEDEDDDEDTDDNDDDDDDDDYSVQYRTTSAEPEKPRRYDLRNSMRKSN
ncbi:hypothetical protein KR038_011825 [Drosophila bunnanda]|nr:hypothetical protein KR038_011825 [Drosophila bunnanda]